MRAPSPSAVSVFWRSGLSAALYLGLSVPALFAGAFALLEAIPLSHGQEQTATPIVVLAVLVGLGLSGGLWGRRLARQFSLPHADRVAWTAGLTFALLTLAGIFGLGRVEQIFVELRLLRGAPIHVIFAVAFTLAAFWVTAGVALAVGWVARGWRFGLGLALWAGLTAAAAFLLADVVQDLLSRRVGAPGAERTATMLTVAFLGNLIAAFVGGGVIGWRFASAPAARAAAPELQPALGARPPA
jgi:hypothetical protein